MYAQAWYLIQTGFDYWFSIDETRHLHQQLHGGILRGAAPARLFRAVQAKPGKSVIFKTIYFYLKQRISFFYKVLEIAGFPGFHIHKTHDKYLHHNKKQQVPATILLALLLAFAGFCWLCCHASLYIIQDYFKNINLIVMHIAINPVKTPVFVVIHDLARKHTAI